MEFFACKRKDKDAMQRIVGKSIVHRGNRLLIMLNILLEVYKRTKYIFDLK